MPHPVHHLKQNHKQQVLNVDTLCWQRLIKTEIKQRFESNTNHNRDNTVISNTHDAASRTSKRRNSDTFNILQQSSSLLVCNQIQLCSFTSNGLMSSFNTKVCWLAFNGAFNTIWVILHLQNYNLSCELTIRIRSTGLAN